MRDSRLQHIVLLTKFSSGLHTNENDYDDPIQFIPERFLKNQYGTKPTGSSYEEKTRRPVYSFGAGRRVCPGQHMAENTLVRVFTLTYFVPHKLTKSAMQRINIAKMVWGLSILPPIDPVTGIQVSLSEIDTDRATAYTNGVSSGPLPFKCQIEPRSAKHVEVLKREYEDAHVVYDQYEKE